MRRRIAVLFGVFALLAVVVGVVIFLNLLQAERDARKFLEEAREARIAYELVVVLEQMEGERNVDESARSRARLLRVVHARMTDLVEETESESYRAAEDLDRRVRSVVAVAGAGVAALLLSMGLGFAYARRKILGPILALRDGVERFGRGESDSRVAVASDDEIGQLGRELNRMADALRRSRDELEDRVRERTRQFVRAARLADMGTFAAGVAHEVNTPLTTIASCAEGFERRLSVGGLPRDEQIRYLRTIAGEAYRAHEITAELLAFSREDPGPVRSVHPGEHVEKAVFLMSHNADRRRVRLAVDCGRDLPAIEANPAELEQAILNVLRNAIDASPEGGEVTVRCRRDDDRIVLEVSDQGPGVDGELRERIFDPFFTTEEPGQGTGLGLALVLRVVEGQGGSVDVDDAPGGGARFRLSWPAGSEG